MPAARGEAEQLVQLLEVPDGGVIALDISPPLDVAPPDQRPILVCMHGLTGGSHESVLARNQFLIARTLIHHP